MRDTKSFKTVFIYGTLLKGMKRHAAMSAAQYMGPAVVAAELHDLGDYPGLLCNANSRTSTVVGELYRLDRALLSRLDSIEGYNRENERDSLFVRQSVIARRFADGSEVEAYSYFFNSYADNRIGHGDYRRHQLEQCEGDRWVLAYGSNLSLARLADRVGTVREIQKGYIAEFDLAFNKRADRRTRKSYANITFSGVQGRCPAVAYKLTAEQIETLDGHEGVPDNYSRISVSFSAESGESRIVETYIASPDALLANASPRADYLDHIMKGYADHAFDSQYLMSVVGRLGDR